MDRRNFLESLATLPSATAGTVREEDPFQTIRELLARRPPGKDSFIWLFTGDSITEGAMHTRGWRSYPEHFAERVHWEMHRKRDVVINTGRSGATAGQIFEERNERVLRFHPTVVSLMIGSNDCAMGGTGRKKFRDNVARLCSNIREQHTLVLLQTPPPIVATPKTDGEIRGDLEAYADILREAANRLKVPLVDHFAHWREVKPKETDLLYWLSDASVHPNQFGHVELARFMFKAIGIYHESSPTCRLFVP